MLSVYLLIRLINWQTQKQVPSILNLLMNKGSTKACTMSQVSTTCFLKYHLCLKRPSFKLLDSLLQEVCITYLNHLFWWFFLCLWICSIDGTIRNKENQFEQTKNSLQQEVCITYPNHLLWWFFHCLWICSIDGTIRNKENQFEQTNNCLDDSQAAKLIFFLVIKEISKHVQWAKCRLLVF
jgi:hypothetical protein